MSFKYINPGYSKLLNLKNYPDYLIDVTPTAAQSRTGVAFKSYAYNSSSFFNGLCTLKGLSTNLGGEFWIKCDFYFDASKPHSIEIGAYNGPRIRLYLPTDSSRSINLYYQGTYRITPFGTDLSKQVFFERSNLRENAVNSIWLNVKCGDADTGYINYAINGRKFSFTEDRVFAYSSSQPCIVQDSYGSTANDISTIFSNIIVSDEYISPYERIVPLTVSSTITDMTLDSETYVADTASQTLLQSVSTTALEEEYGSDAKVTGVALIGNPAYEVDDIIGSLTSITKQNGTVTDHENITLLTDSDAMILSSFAMPTDTTVADLADIQFGWRTEE